MDEAKHTERASCVGWIDKQRYSKEVAREREQKTSVWTERGMFNGGWERERRFEPTQNRENKSNLTGSYDLRVYVLANIFVREIERKREKKTPNGSMNDKRTGWKLLHSYTNKYSVIRYHS